MVGPSGWQCHPVATEERFTQVNFDFLILTVNGKLEKSRLSLTNMNVS